MQLDMLPKVESMIEREFLFAMNTSDIGKYIRDRLCSGDGKSLQVVIMPMAGPDISGRHFSDGRGYQVSSERRPAQLPEAMLGFLSASLSA